MKNSAEKFNIFKIEKFKISLNGWIYTWELNNVILACY